MTCIAALTHEDKVYMAGDSAGVAGYSVTVRADSKVFRTGEFLFGFSGSFRLGDLLRYSFTPPAHAPEISTDRYIATAFIEAVRKILKDGGHMTVTSNRESTGGAFLVGYRRRIYRIDADLQVGRSVDTFESVGCGADIALGALAVTSQVEPRARLKAALKASARFSAGVRAPFRVLSL